MGKYKVGDRVRILDGRGNSNIHPTWVEEMDEFIGTVHTVEYMFSDSSYGLSETHYLFAEEWLALAEFTKHDLKEFDVVEFRNSNKTLVIKDAIDNALAIGGYYIGGWTDDLRDSTGSDKYDIIKVYRPTDSLPLDRNKWKDLPVVYERTEVKEMTVEEISKALGYEVKVVK